MTSRDARMHLHLDGNAGISGNMFLGALLDAGAPQATLIGARDALGLSHIGLHIGETHRRGFRALHVEVDDEPDAPARHLSDIRQRIEASGLPAHVVTQSLAVFQTLGEAEAAVHGTSIDAVHFHEVGAADAMIDIVGTCALLDALNIDTLSVSPLRLGSGTVKCAHGDVAVPAPATARLLIGVPVFAGDVPGEHTTPTGAALVKTLCTVFGAHRTFIHRHIGHGAGGRDPAFPNIARVRMGSVVETSALDATHREPVIELVCHLDDTTPEALADASARLMERGALDVATSPLVMKKGRAAHQLIVLAAPAQETSLTAALFRYTTTLGIRRRELERTVRPTTARTVATRFGAVEGKACEGRFFPEYASAAAAARTHDVSVDEVFAAAKTADAAGR